MHYVLFGVCGLGPSFATHRCGLLLHMLPVPWFVCLYVGTPLNRANTAEPIQMPLGGQTQVGQRNRVLDGDPYLRHLTNRVERFVCGDDAILSHLLRTVP